MIELLAPAGDLEKLKIALLYGADAVYIGGRNFSLRANAKNFSLEEIKMAVEFAHKLGKKVYVTVNIILHDEDVVGLEEYLKELSNIKVDAIIVSDVYIISLIKKLNIPLEVHLSTQASVLNAYAAKFYKDLGVTRIVLAREANKNDIIEIKEKTGLELECFIHGAMCTSISGRCILSNVTTNRDANRGGCAQICRWTFKDENNSSFSMTSKDLNMIPYIEDMINVGDIVEFFGPNMETFTYEIHTIENDKQEKIEVANHPNMIVKMMIPKELHKYDMMRIKVFDKQ